MPRSRNARKEAEEGSGQPPRTRSRGRSAWADFWGGVHGRWPRRLLIKPVRRRRAAGPARSGHPRNVAVREPSRAARVVTLVAGGAPLAVRRPGLPPAAPRSLQAPDELRRRAARPPRRSKFAEGMITARRLAGGGPAPAFCGPEGRERPTPCPAFCRLAPPPVPRPHDRGHSAALAQRPAPRPRGPAHQRAATRAAAKLRRGTGDRRSGCGLAHIVRALVSAS